jgi:hypothetical protein
MKNDRDLFDSLTEKRREREMSGLQGEREQRE